MRARPPLWPKGFSVQGSIAPTKIEIAVSVAGPSIRPWYRSGRTRGRRWMEGAPMKVTQHLWFAKDMEAAIGFYTSLVRGSSVHWVSSLPAESPSGPAGSVKIVVPVPGVPRLPSRIVAGLLPLLSPA